MRLAVSGSGAPGATTMVDAPRRALNLAPAELVVVIGSPLGKHYASLTFAEAGRQGRNRPRLRHELANDEQHTLTPFCANVKLVFYKLAWERAARMRPRIIHTDRVPPGRAQISQAVVFGDFVFVSGIVARDPTTGKTVTGGVAAQTRQILENTRSILEA